MRYPPLGAVFRERRLSSTEQDSHDMAFTVKRYQNLVIRRLGANIEGPENISKIERGCTVYLDSLVIILRTAGDVALVLPLARTGSLVIFEEVVSPSDA